MLASARLSEEGCKGIIVVHLVVKVTEGAVRFNAMLQAKKLPACITNLNASLADMNGDTLTL